MISSIGMNLYFLFVGALLFAIAWALWAGTRVGRRNARLRRLYERRKLTASVAEPAEAAALNQITAVDDRQMNLFTDLPQEIRQALPASVVRPGPILRRRAERLPGERLDRQYFNKDSGDLHYPEAKDRRKPLGQVRPQASDRPERRA